MYCIEPYISYVVGKHRIFQAAQHTKFGRVGGRSCLRQNFIYHKHRTSIIHVFRIVVMYEYDYLG